jgi:monofunctional biosynthetic peptidoglycan transglycosylase
MSRYKRKKLKLSRLIKISLIFFSILLLIPVYMYFSDDVSRMNSEWPHVVIPKDPEEKVEYEFKTVAPSYWVRLDQISSYGKWAIILSEDWGFYDHQGVDYDELKKAIDESVRELRLVRGASTISQQVVKNVFLSSNRSIIRKVHELILTQKMEKVVPKKKILETYFNIVEFGPKIYGIRNASYHYFKKHPSALNPREAAFLAMLLPSPKRYYISFKNKKLTGFARSRIKAILLKMRWARILTEEQRQLWLSQNFFWEL